MRICVFLTLCIIVMISGGCYKVYYNSQPSVLDVSFQQQQKIPLRAGLYMPEDFRNYTHEWKVEFGKHVFPLGEMLQDGSKKMIAAAFREMVVLASPDEAKAQGVNIVITPRVESAEYVYETKFKGPPISMVIIKWTALDQEGNILWADTFEGKGQDEVVDRRKQVNKYGIAVDNLGLAIEDSLNKAYEALMELGTSILAAT